MASGWAYCHNLNHSSRGRILILWNPNLVHFNVSCMPVQCIHGMISVPRLGCSIKVTFAYGLHSTADRETLCTELKNIETDQQGPWMCMGDFNTLLLVDDRLGGNPIQDAEMKDFNDFLLDTFMVVLKSVGRRFTWSNSHICSRIDWAIGNADWMLQVPHLEVKVLDLGCSDHSPLSILLDSEEQTDYKPFKFLNCLADHAEFKVVIKKAWEINTSGPLMMKVWRKLKIAKQGLKVLNSKDYKLVGRKVNELREKLGEIQNCMRDHRQYQNMFDEEKLIKEQVEKWSNIEENMLRQKSRVQWLKLGDSNTAYFHASLKSRNAQNIIHCLVTERGKWIHNRDNIQDEILSFYKNLLGRSADQLPVVNVAVIRQGHCLTRQQQLDLIAPVTSDEVENVLNGIDDSKAPGCDGYNALFFKKVWPIIGKDIIEAVLEFFSTGRMNKAINCTTITLIPKVPNASRVTELRHISF